MIKVIAKKRQFKNSIALYLDYKINGKRIQESTGLHIFPEKNKTIRQQNKDNWVRFEILRNAKQTELLNGIAELPLNKSKVNFIEYYKQYFERYPSSPKRVNAVLKKLIDFNKSTHIPASVIDESYLTKFKIYLENSLTGETPHNYFKLLGRVIRQATKDRFFKTNPIIDISIRKKEGIPKEVLNIDEIKILIESPCSNANVKQAFLFSCFTGLRYCDVSKLKWENIKDNKLQIIQSKTKKSISCLLHTNAIEILKGREQDNNLIFTLPTSLNGCNKVLKYWVKKSGINKKITWHCARHSFATNLITYDANPMAVSSMMGSIGLPILNRYIKRNDKMIQIAMAKIPIL